MPLYAPVSTRTMGHGGQPEDHGLFAWTFDPALSVSSTAFATAGTMYGSRIYVPRTVTATNLVAYVVGAGATLTAGSCKAAIYNSAGTLLQTTVDQATAWASTGVKLMALVAPLVLAAGYYDIGAWFTGTTGPTMTRGTANASGNANISGTTARFWTGATALTTTAPATVGTKATFSTDFWYAVN